MVVTTPADVRWAPTTSLKPGTYFTCGGQWVLALDEPIAVDNHPYSHTVRVAYPNGQTATIGLFGERRSVAADGTRPAEFDPHTLVLAAQADEATAQELLDRAGARRRLARKLQSGAVIS